MKNLIFRSYSPQLLSFVFSEFEQATSRADRLMTTANNVIEDCAGFMLSGTSFETGKVPQC